MSLMHSTASAQDTSVNTHNIIFDREKIIGCMYLLAAVFILLSNFALQAATLGDFPAPMSVYAITSLIGVFITRVAELLQNHKWDFGWEFVGSLETMSYITLVGMIGGVCLSFNGWGNEEKRASFCIHVSPIATVISVILSAITLGDSIDIGSLRYVPHVHRSLLRVVG